MGLRLMYIFLPSCACGLGVLWWFRLVVYCRFVLVTFRLCFWVAYGFDLLVAVISSVVVV